MSNPIRRIYGCVLDRVARRYHGGMPVDIANINADVGNGVYGTVGSCKKHQITGLGLAEAKAVVDGSPKTIKEQVSKDEANAMKAKFEEVGAKVELK